MKGDDSPGIEERIHNGDEKIKNAKNLVMIQMRRLPDEDRNYWQRICCGESIKNA